MWETKPFRVAGAYSFSTFLQEYLLPLFFWRTTSAMRIGRGIASIDSEEKFWTHCADYLFDEVRLAGFSITDWFPRSPGVYWTKRGRDARHSFSGYVHSDAELGDYYLPEGKLAFIEAGIGTIRLRPRRIDGEDCWLATAVKGTECHAGIPLAIPDAVFRQAGVCWGDTVSMQGRVRFLQDAGLDHIASAIHGTRPLIVFVHELENWNDGKPQNSLSIAPVVLFDSNDVKGRADFQYSFVQCAAGSDSSLDAAADWMSKYAAKHGGRVITNFDEQRPTLADAPLSYQRLIARTHDRALIERFMGSIYVDRVDQLFQDSIITQSGDIHMGHKIKVGGPANINIDSVLNNASQTIDAAAGLDPEQRAELDKLVESLKADLDSLSASHADEVREVAAALEKALSNAAKAPQDRKQSLLQLSAKGLLDAAALVKEIAPTVLSTADLIAKFIVGL